MKQHNINLTLANVIKQCLYKAPKGAGMLLCAIMPFQSAMADQYADAYVSSSEATGSVNTNTEYYPFDKICKNSPSFRSSAYFNFTSTAGTYVTINKVSITALPKHESALSWWTMFSGGSDLHSGEIYYEYLAGKSTIRTLSGTTNKSYKWRVNASGTYLTLEGDFEYYNNDIAYCRGLSMLYTLHRR